MPSTRPQTIAVTLTHNTALRIRLPTLLQKQKTTLVTPKGTERDRDSFNRCPKTSTILVLVSFIVENSKRDNEEDKNSISNVNSKP